MVTDLRQALRLLARSRGFAVTTILILALGIGANTAVFSIVRAVLLRPLPYHEPDRVVFLWRNPHTSADGHGIMTGEQVHQFSARGTMLSSFAVMKVWSALHTPIDLLQDDSADRLRGVLATPNFFELLGVRAALGRTFLPSDHEGEPVVVLSDAAWRRAFGGDPGAVGRRVLLRQTRDRRGWTSHLVVGVLPPAFRHTYPEETEIYGLLPWTAIRARGALEFSMIARLKPGASAAAAEAELTGVAKEMARARNYPPGIRDEIIDRERVVVEPVADHFARDVRPGVLLLGAMAALVLLIACVNLALLALARGVDRGREFAMRSALGASPSRLVRQLAVEGVALAAAGGIIGLAAAAVGLPLLRRLVPAVVPHADEIAIDTQVLTFALAATGITAVACGLTPAWIAIGRRMQPALRQSGGAATASRAVSRSRQAVVGVQVAVVLVLLAGGALLLHSFWRLHRVDLGFDGSGVITMEMRLLNPKYREPGRIAAFERELLDRVRALPGVQRASLTTAVPLRRGGVDFTMVVGPPGGRRQFGQMRSVDPEYFAIMQIPLLAGRLLRADDTAAAPMVMVVSESYGRVHFGNLNPVGRSLQFQEGLREIVGVVGDVRTADVAGQPPPAFYLPRAQQSNELLVLVARAAPGMQAAVIADVRTAVRALDPEQPIQHVTTLDAVVADATSEQRFYALTTAAFAAIALALAVAGLVGVVSRSISERRREIAIRVALGAGRSSLLRLVFAYGLTPVVFGMLAGLWTAVAGATLLQKFLFEVDAADPLTLASVSVLLLTVACAACYLPARRAINVEPMGALRSE
jgi:putative ABC transport system permease protein